MPDSKQTPVYPDFSQPSVMNPKYGPYAAKLLGPLIRELQRQQQFGQAFGVSPRQAIKPTPEEMQRALNVGLAFGGADITKEQKEAWEAENEAFRAKQVGKASRGTPELYPPGTRVQARPKGLRTDADWSAYSRERAGSSRHVMQGAQGQEGMIVTPGTPEAGPPLVTGSEKQNMPGYVAVRRDRDPGWIWLHRDALEILPTEHFPEGTGVVIQPEWGDLADHGMVAKPPTGAIPRPGPDYEWVDGHLHPEDSEPPPEGYGYKGVIRYKTGDWGAWIHRNHLEKKVKK